MMWKRATSLVTTEKDKIGKSKEKNQENMLLDVQRHSF